MTGKVEKWKALPDEEKQKVLDAFKRRIDNLVYSDICKSYERYQEVGGNYKWEHPVLLLRLADEKMTSHILSWLYSEVETSQGKMNIPFGGYFLEEITFDKSSLMAYDDEEKEVLRKAIQIIRNKGVGNEYE